MQVMEKVRGLTRRHLPTARSQEPSRPTLSVDDRRALVVAALRAKGKQRFKTMRSIELMTLPNLRTLPTAGTVLQVAVDALNVAGVTTGSTAGSVMDVLNLNQEQLDHGVCHCVNGAEMTGNRAAENFAKFA